MTVAKYKYGDKVHIIKKWKTMPDDIENYIVSGVVKVHVEPNHLSGDFVLETYYRLADPNGTDTLEVGGYGESRIQPGWVEKEVPSD